MTGNYGFVQAPTPYFWGGTWMGVAKASTNKDLAWQFVKYVTTSTEFLTAYSKNDFVNNTDIQATVSASADGNNAFLGGQNIYKPYTALVKNVNGDLITEYDDTINNAFNADVDLFVNGKIASKDALMTKFKADVKSAYPDLNVG
jgi:ABC-type glycerol-3-phosphate transport system substrate-binding protein